MAERLKLGELLIMGGAIDQTQLGAALAHQRQFPQPLGKTLVSMGFLDEETLVRTLVRQLKIPVAWLDGKWVDRELVELIPAELALKHCCLPLALTEDKGAKTLHPAVLDPGDIEALDLIGFQVGHQVSPVLAAPTELEEAVQRHYAQGGGRGTGGSRQLAPCRERYERDPVRADCQVDPAARPPQAARVVSPAVEVPLGTSASGEGP